MAIPVYESFSQTGFNSAGGSITAGSFPSGLATGDILVAFVFGRYTLSAFNINAETGWVDTPQAASSGATGGTRTRVFLRRVPDIGTEPLPTFDYSIGNVSQRVVVLVRVSAGSETPHASSQGNEINANGSNPITVSGITMSAKDTLLLSGWAFTRSITTGAPNNGWTSIVNGDPTSMEFAVNRKTNTGANPGGYEQTTSNGGDVSFSSVAVAEPVSTGRKLLVAGMIG